MTKDGSFKKVVRRHAQETGQRYTEALTDLEGLERADVPRARRRAPARPSPGSLRHRRRRGDEDQPAQRPRVPHRPPRRRSVDCAVFPPARPRAGVEGDAAILRFLERQDYPAERLAVDDAVSDFDGTSVLVTRFVAGGPPSRTAARSSP